MQEEFGIARMLEILSELLEKYKERWKPIGPRCRQEYMKRDYANKNHTMFNTSAEEE